MDKNWKLVKSTKHNDMYSLKIVLENILDLIKVGITFVFFNKYPKQITKT